ncbi:MAG: hypothetical protein AAF846_12760 [Chloroflexota bacterium]
MSNTNYQRDKPTNLDATAKRIQHHWARYRMSPDNLFTRGLLAGRITRTLYLYIRSKTNKEQGEQTDE